MQHNLARMQRAGATVQYYQADVHDEAAIVELINGIYREFGRLDGVIHGAGVIEDKLIEDKTPASFDRVFDTKADSAFILYRVLRPDSLQFLVLFSSAAGTFGNRGQCDYAAANEVLNKMALYLDQRWPGRVVAISWGPWAKAGMVSPALQREFVRRGVQSIPVPTGCRLFTQELQHGQKGEAAVILASGAWAEARPAGAVTVSPTLPLLHRATSTNGSNSGHVEIVRPLEPSHDLYLRDHQLDNKPVLPVAMAMELMAEVAQQAWPDLAVVGLRALHVLRGVIVENGLKTIRLVARGQEAPPRERLGIDVNVEITDPESPGRPYYRAVVELGDRWPESPLYQSPLDNSLQPFPMTVDDAYRQWLFHGPLFRGISKIEGVTDRGMTALLTPSVPRQCLKDIQAGQWLIDPVVFDSGLQLVLLWARMHTGMTPLPSRFQRYRYFRPLAGPLIRCHMLVDATQEAHALCINLVFVGPDNQVLGALEDLQCTSSKALNRLGGSTV